jgi:hypothetical protein
MEEFIKYAPSEGFLGLWVIHDFIIYISMLSFPPFNHHPAKNSNF